MIGRPVYGPEPGSTWSTFGGTTTIGMQPVVEGKWADLQLTLPTQRTRALLSVPTVRAVRNYDHPDEFETRLRRFYYHGIASRKCWGDFLQRNQEGVVERLNAAVCQRDRRRAMLSYPP